MAKKPISETRADEYGRLRVRDKDTGHERSIPESHLAHGNYVVLDAPASHPLTGDPLPVKHHEFLSGPNTRGQQADNTEENTDG